MCYILFFLCECLFSEKDSNEDCNHQSFKIRDNNQAVVHAYPQ